MTEPDQSRLLTYPELVGEMQRWCAEKRSGTIWVATEDNHLAKILFEHGDITHVAYGLKSGREAVLLLKRIGQARVGLSHGAGTAHPVARTTPPTAEVMALLAAGAGAPAGPSPGGAPLGDERVAKALKVIETELIEHLGPLASIVWAEHRDRLGEPVSERLLAELIERLAQEIGDPARARNFMDGVRQKLRGA